MRIASALCAVAFVALACRALADDVKKAADHTADAVKNTDAGRIAKGES